LKAPTTWRLPPRHLRGRKDPEADIQHLMALARKPTPVQSWLCGEGSRGAIKERLFTRDNPEHSPAAKDLVAEYQERTDRARGQLREAFGRDAIRRDATQRFVGWHDRLGFRIEPGTGDHG
jgi:hypothetical protein